ncbi:methanogenesis marker 8 protein [Methanothermobacter sp.]|uniref:methanogenesis marker 8 protein n=1 Tax=Methanothermobacter sp. TaxID=1884223 RepID=UPI00261D1A6F|nr:methanogenesis marker 8 protein [Methanothermobacter sp.]MDI9617971.1 DUF2099 family protein [Methanothermobacter sp.]
MDEHVIEALGKTRVTVRDGKVVHVSKPLIHYCPLFHRYRGIEKITPEAVRQNIEFRIKDFGMCTANRELRMRDFLSFGISEIISTLLAEGEVEAAVMVCDGAGTVIVTEPELAQGIGGRISGFISTSPKKNVIEKIGPENVLDTHKATIDQVKGVERALEMGYRRVAVTVKDPDEAEQLRKIRDEEIYLFAVHLTGIDYRGAEKIINTCDVVTSCASKYIRRIADRRALLKVGSSIPIYACTKKGKRFIELRMERIGAAGNKNPEKNPVSPEPLV